MWTNSEENLELFRLTFEGPKARFFIPEHALLLNPTLESYNGQLIEDPPSIQNLLQNWKVVYSMQNYVAVRKKHKLATGKRKTDLNRNSSLHRRS